MCVSSPIWSVEPIAGQSFRDDPAPSNLRKAFQYQPSRKPSIQTMLGKSMNKRRHQFSGTHYLRLLNTSALCNDGTPAGYYLRVVNLQYPQNWLIYLEGGWYCYSKETCGVRKSITNSLFSSTYWPYQRTFTGILSADPVINPIYFNFNSIFIPYCSSDLWTGKRANRTEDFYFHGSRIIRAVIDDVPWKLPVNIERVIFAGSSAGGIGLLMNIDRLHRHMVRIFQHPILVSGIVDSGWFINMPAYQKPDCSDLNDCPTVEGIRQGMRYWSARIPKSCRRSYGRERKWKCYLAPLLYEHVKTPVYIVQSLFDEAQMQMSKISFLTGGTYEKWAYIQNLGRQVAESLKKTSGVFAPSCIDHDLITRNDWVHKAIGRIGLVEALRAWDEHLISEWKHRIFLKWSLHNQETLLLFSKRYLPLGPELRVEGQPTKIQFRRNSTFLLLSRLIFLLNARFQHRNISTKQGRTIIRDPFIYPIKRAHSSLWKLVNRRSTLHASYHEKLFMELTRNFYPHTDDKSSYHLIDSCGLISRTDGKLDGQLCGNKSINFVSSRLQSVHIIPLCNPTCGFASNPHRMKLMDILALYDVNTDLLANILGLTPAELKNMNSEEQMRNLFCGH